MSRLNGKVVLLTGAAGTIGSAAALRFAGAGADLILVDLPIKTEDLEALAEQVRSFGNEALVATADITRQDQIDEAFAKGVNRFGSISGVFANAGVISRGNLEDRIGVEEASWQESLDINVTGTWRTIRAASAPLKAAGGGSIVITSSIAGIRGGLNNAAYSATKHAVLGIAKTAAHELGRYGIRVNSVLPTGVKSEMFVRPARIAQARPDLANPTYEDAAEVWKSTNLLGVPWVEAVDVANAVLFLLSDEARYVTGVALPVDAGQSQLNPFIALEDWLRRGN